MRRKRVCVEKSKGVYDYEHKDDDQKSGISTNGLDDDCIRADSAFIWRGRDVDKQRGRQLERCGQLGWRCRRRRGVARGFQ